MVTFPHGGGAAIFADAIQPDKAEVRDWTSLVEDILVPVRDAATVGDAAAVLADGEIIYFGGFPYKKLASATGSASITADLGVDGFVPASVVTPRMCGAAGDGATDDVSFIQKAWNYSGSLKIPCHMEGLEYNASAELFYVNGMTVIGGGCVLYPTAWPTTGGFLTNVVADAASRIMGDIYMEDVIADGSKLPAPGVAANSNLFDGAWGLYRSRFVRCKARKIRHGFGGGTGGAGFGVEQGAQDIVYEDCIAEDCYRAVRLAGFDTSHAAPNSEPKRVVGINFRNFTARRCWTALFAHTVGAPDGERSTVNLGTMSTIFDGVTVEDCGHAAWFDFDFVTYATVPAQKSGVFVIAGYEGLIVSNVTVKLNSTYPASFTDWLGNSAYPANGTAYIGEGLSGDVGALIWGWGNEVLFENVLLDGDVDSILHIGRANSFGEFGASPPTTGTANEKCQGLQLRNIRQVAGAVVNVVSGIAGMNDSRTGIDLYGLKLFVEPTGGVSDANVGVLERIMIEVVTSAGRRTRGTAKAFYDGSYAVTQTPDETFLGSVAFGGGYSSSGAKDGILHDAAAGIMRQSVDEATARFHHAFYNPNGLVGSIQTNGSATSYATSSDGRLKSDLRDFDGLAMIRALGVYDFEWKDGRRDLGVIAQEAISVVPGAVTVGDDDSAWTIKPIGERVPWAVDYSKLVPALIRAVQQLEAKLAEAAPTDQ